MFLLLIAAAAVASVRGQTTSVECEGQTLCIECPAGKVISVTSANYGRTDPTICCDLNPNPDVTCCIYPDSLTVMQGLCNDQNSCHVPATNAVFADMCVGTYKYLTATYDCVDPVDGCWGPWSEYTQCTVTCGGGTKQRTRQCDSPAPAYGGAPCEGPDTETADCNTAECPPVDGCWGPWSEYGPCSVTCGGGTKERTRQCDSPAPANGGAPCEGSDTDSQPCNSDQCTSVACEGQTLCIACPGDKVISVTSANYGRTDPTICCDLNPNPEDTCCVYPDSLTVMQGLCDGLNSCDVPATNAVFADMCVGTYKYLEATYDCDDPPPICG